MGSAARESAQPLTHKHPAESARRTLLVYTDLCTMSRFSHSVPPLFLNTLVGSRTNILQPSSTSSWRLRNQPSPSDRAHRSRAQPQLRDEEDVQGCFTSVSVLIVVLRRVRGKHLSIWPQAASRRHANRPQWPVAPRFDLLDQREHLLLFSAKGRKEPCLHKNSTAECRSWN